MEVHHHSHHPKKWKEYITEFLMLFLAVFAGFMAESYLEYRTERHKEHDFLSSLKKDLALDTIAINKSLNYFKSFDKSVDELIDVTNGDLNSRESQYKLYQVHMKLVNVDMNVPFSSGTLEQLKSAGGLRLIQDDSIRLAITEYDNGIKAAHQMMLGILEGIRIQFQTTNKFLEHQIATWSDTAFFQLNDSIFNALYEKNGTTLITSDNTSKAIERNTWLLIRGYCHYYLMYCRAQKQRAIILINKLNEKHH